MTIPLNVRYSGWDPDRTGDVEPEWDSQPVAP